MTTDSVIIEKLAHQILPLTARRTKALWMTHKFSDAVGRVGNIMTYFEIPSVSHYRPKDAEWGRHRESATLNNDGRGKVMRPANEYWRSR